jgi:LmbE family N-acetylglucosaminyl deacetylase
MLSDRDLIQRQMGNPAILRLSRALGRLTSVLTWMNTGAHPDDEHSGLLAALRYRFGMRVVILCSTRGEGGQNTIGPERGAALGVLRTRELEEAARVLDAGIAWIGHGPQDAIFDFGFSKNADDTLARWGEDTVVERMVEAYRRYRPDIVEVTFLDVPGQHGHHRAMTRAALAAFDRAGDPDAFPDQIAAGLDPWQVAKLYLPAWSGAGSSYDDEEPPPAATVTISAPGRDPVTGATYAQIGEWSRCFHATQRMGQWQEAGPHQWPLHLARSAVHASDEDDVRDGLPATIGALAGLPDMPADTARHLREAQVAVDAAVAAFPDGLRITEAALRAAAAIDGARVACPPQLKPRIAHRLARKARELDVVLLEAAGLSVRAFARPSRIAPGELGAVSVVASLAGAATDLSVSVSGRNGLSVGTAVSDDAGQHFPVAASSRTSFTNPFPASFDPLVSNGELTVSVSARIDGRTVERTIDLEEPFRILPPSSLSFDPDAVVVNLARPVSAISIAARVEGASAPVSLIAPDGWSVSAAAGGFTLTPPASPTSGRFTIAATVAGEPASRVRAARYAHIGRTEWAEPVALPGIVVNAALPEGVRVAYAGGGNDQVDVWLRRLGVAVTALDADTLGVVDLAAFTTIVVGIFAFGTRTDLAAARRRLRDWVEAGGHLVTLYHRPSDGWLPDETPPRHLEIGLPSLRWRVTSPNAPVAVLLPDHPLLTRPNLIGPADWEGWDKERGLYFASRWDDAYRPLLAMSDKGEAPLSGSLVSAVIGQGRHTHTSLALHHQLDCLVPGPFRLMANLIQPAS